jgi:hypothetical protein
MTENIQQSLNACRKLEEAWNVLMRLRVYSGRILLASEQFNGSITFRDGKIIASYVAETGLTGEAAFNQLVLAQDARCIYQADPDAGLKTPSKVAANSPNRTASPAPTAAPPVTAAAPPAPNAHPASAPNAHPASAPNVTPTPAPNAPPAPGAELPGSQTMPGQTIPELRPVELTAGSSTEEERREFLSDTGLLQTDEGLPDERKKILAVAGQFVDDEAFAQVAFPDLQSMQSLSEQQQEAMQALVALADKHQFARQTGALEDSSLTINDEQLWMLGEVLLSRSSDTQRQEFVQMDARLVAQQDEHLRPFTEPPLAQPSEQAEAPLSRMIPSYATDFGRSDAMVTDEFKAKQTNFLKRSITSFDNIAAVARRPTPVNKAFIGPSLVAGVCVALFTVPALLRNSAESTLEPELAQQTAEFIVDEEMESSVPRRHAQPFELPAGTLNSSAPESKGEQSGLNPEVAPVPQAGRTGDALIDSLEKQLAQNSLSIESRIELIRLYKARKDLKRARELAVLGFKLPTATAEERQKLWQLFKECQ